MSPILYFLFGGVWIPNPESCRSKRARYHLSHPSPYFSHPTSYLATHLPILATHLPPYLSYPSTSLSGFLIWPEALEVLSGSCTLAECQGDRSDSCAWDERKADIIRLTSAAAVHEVQAEPLSFRKLYLKV
jgi:hypothetical protein